MLPNYKLFIFISFFNTSNAIYRSNLLKYLLKILNQVFEKSPKGSKLVI